MNGALSLRKIGSMKKHVGVLVQAFFPKRQQAPPHGNGRVTRSMLLECCQQFSA
jgi:hypothetical protein